MLGRDEIENRFGFHKATIEGDNATLPKHRETRLKFREFAEFLDVLLPDGRAKWVAFAELENASMWSHKAIAEKAPPVGEDEGEFERPRPNFSRLLQEDRLRAQEKLNKAVAEKAHP